MRCQQDFFAKQSSFNLDQHHYPPIHRRGQMESEQFDILILDEINNPLHLHLVDLEQVLEMIRKAPEHPASFLCPFLCPVWLYPKVSIDVFSQFRLSQVIL